MRDTLSARADDELGVLGSSEVQQHLVGCTSCRTFEARLPALVRQQRLHEAVVVPDLTASVLLALASRTQEDQTIRRQQLRGVLGLIGLTQAIVAIAALLVDGGHLSRELATWQLGLGFGFMVAAWQPSRAAGLLPMVSVLGLTAIVSAVGDLATGATTITAELGHLVEVAGVGLVWGVARLAGSGHQTSAAPARL